MRPAAPQRKKGDHNRSASSQQRKGSQNRLANSREETETGRLMPWMYSPVRTHPSHTYALAWCGWRVEPIDWLLNAHHDLSKLKVQQALATLVDSCGAAIWAVDCSTLSRAREVAIPGHSGGPKFLRAESAVRGLQSLAGRDATRVEQANLFIDFTFAQVAKSVTAGKAAILESPARSHLWGFQQLKDIRKMPEWRRTLYDACCWGGARRKQQALESNVPEIQALKSSCHHVHSNSEWTPYRGADGAMVYPSSGEAGYTADLAFAMAVALS